MKIGFVSAILPNLNFEGVLVVANEHDYQHVEVCCWPKAAAEDRRYAGVTHIDVDNFDADEVKGQAEDAGVTLTLGYYPNPLDANQQAADTCVAHLRKVIESAPKLGVDIVNTFAGRNQHQTVDDNWERFLATFKPLVALAEENGVTLCIENCPMLFGKDQQPYGQNLAHSPAIWERMFSDIPSDNFGLNYDPAHMIWQRMDHLLPLTQFQDRIRHIHIKDVRIDKAKLDQVGILAVPLAHHTPVIPGRGEINWGRFISILASNGYDGPACVEVEDESFEDAQGSSEGGIAALRVSAAHLSNFI